jgi:hypothetical protein
MKFVIISLFICFSSVKVYSQKNKAIFLIHSTGTNLFSEGKVSDWVKTYNSANSTSFQINTRAYPNTPWPWENYPYDYWKLWVDNSCNNSDSDIECLASIAANYGLVIFKHCYPGAGIESDIGKPDIRSSRKSLENYKLQYRALRTLMDGIPDKKFMVWTLVPLHRLATSAEAASRAYEFVNWVKTQWLTEDGKLHPNISVFDFFSLAAELNKTPTNGKQYCLKYDYEYSHTSNDSHPNTLANATIGPVFAQAVVKVLASNFYTSSISVNSTGENSITSQNGTLQVSASILPEDAANKTVSWSVVNVSGEASISASGLITARKNGTVKVIATANDGSGVKGELLITISNQNILVQSISIIDNLKLDTIHGIGTKVLLKASIIPENATNQTISWSVENLTGQASIDKDGLLITSMPGTIRINAKANDESNMISKKEYLIAIPDFARIYENPILFKIYSNSSDKKIQIQIDKLPIEGINLEIRNLLGQKILEQKIFNTITELNLTQYPKSIYFISLRSKNKLTTKKIIF